MTAVPARAVSPPRAPCRRMGTPSRLHARLPMKTQSDIPERFRVARSTLQIDRFMTWAIKSGGVLIVLAVFGIFFFILAETLPLFSPASLEREDDLHSRLPAGALLLACTPEGDPLLETEAGRFETVDLRTGVSKTVPLAVPQGFIPSARQYLSEKRALLLASERGQAAIVPMPVGDRAAALAPVPDIRVFPLEKDVENGDPALAVDYASSGEAAIIGAIQTKNGARRLRLVYLEASRGLMGSGAEEPVAWHDATPLLPATPSTLLVSNDAHSVVVGTEDGSLIFLEVDAEGVSVAQTMPRPLPEGEKPVAMEWIFGGSTLIVAGGHGSLRGYSRFWHDMPGGGRRMLFGLTKEYESLPGRADALLASPCNKSFLAAGGGQLRLFFNTTAEERLRCDPGARVVQMASSSDFSNLVLLDARGTVRAARLYDPFPQASWKALFGKNWYEGYPAPSWEWQSSAANEDAEPKLSLVTLIFGTLKGTLYAMLFATPVALAAAVYTAHFMPAGAKRVVKPLMEVMASLPSVVLGFFGALYLAPRLEDKTPALLLSALALPLAAMLLGFIWSRVPAAWRNQVSRGVEYAVLIPLTALIVWLVWEYGGSVFESLLVGAARRIGEMAGRPCEADTFRQMWENGFGLPYEQRNALVVGIAMGFAVIPVIFTIAEDALSAVPSGLLAASDAMGASRWQTVRMVVLPVASAGIFSALMIGLGRAVGETMIVLMATGNTPVMDWNIMNGMRTLSANIATELPEAVERSGHYRILFLSALLLFMMTFALNTAAEMLRRRLRRKFNAAS